MTTTDTVNGYSDGAGEEAAGTDGDGDADGDWREAKQPSAFYQCNGHGTRDRRYVQYLLPKYLLGSSSCGCFNEWKGRGQTSLTSMPSCTRT